MEQHGQSPDRVFPEPVGAAQGCNNTRRSLTSEQRFSLWMSMITVDIWKNIYDDLEQMLIVEKVA